MRQTLLLTVVMLAVFSAAAGQDRSVLLDRLSDLMQKPAAAQPVDCNDEEVRFDRIELKGSTLHLVKNIHYKYESGTRTELRYEIPLDQIARDRSKVGEHQKCSTTITLHSRGKQRAFTSERVHYLNNQLEEREILAERELHLQVYRGSGSPILDLLFELKASL